MKNVANEDLELVFTSTSISGTIVVTTQPDPKVLTSGKKTFFGVLGIAITNASNGTCAGASGAGTITPTAQYVNGGGLPALLEGDTSGLITLTNSATPCSFTAKVKVKKAGQDKVSAL